MLKSMPLTLAISTATRRIAVALLENGIVKKECEWSGKNDESQKLLPGIKRLLKASKNDFSNIKAVLVVSGPGPFSSLRIGVTVANVLAAALRVPLYEIGVQELWSLPQNLSIFQDLNEQEFRDLQAIQSKETKSAPKAPGKMLKFGQALEKLPRRSWGKRPIVTPKYWRPPTITQSRNVLLKQISPS